MATDPETLYRGYLTVTPLDKIFASGKRRYVVLTRGSPYQPASLELEFFADYHMMDKKGQMSLARVTKIHPTFGKPKELAFAVETKERKLVFKAEEEAERNIWVAKLYELCGTDHSVHVTVPGQPTLTYSEGLLKLANPAAVRVVCPSAHSVLLDVPFKDIRRFGYELAFDTDLIWIETCNCKLRQNSFIFFTVSSGMDRALAVLFELKSKIEVNTGSLLIQEKHTDTHVSFIARLHYGCTSFPDAARDRCLQTGIFSLPRGWGGEMALVKRRQSSYQYRSSIDSNSERRNTVITVPSISPTALSPVHSPSHHSRSPSPARSPIHSPSPTPPGRKMTLDQIHNRGVFQHADTIDGDSGVPQESFDPSRYSAPCRLSPYPAKAALPQGSLSDSRDHHHHPSGRQSLDSFRPGGGKRAATLAERSQRVPGEQLAVSLDGRRRKMSSEHRGVSLDQQPSPGGGRTLDQLYHRTGGGSVGSSPQPKHFPSKDSAFGDGEEAPAYDHLGSMVDACNQMKISPKLSRTKAH